MLLRALGAALLAAVLAALVACGDGPAAERPGVVAPAGTTTDRGEATPSAQSRAVVYFVHAEH